MTGISMPADGRHALYRQVVQRLLARIDSGHIQVGDSLPPEPNLAEQYAVSRHTMREALRILRDMGVIDRKPGAGTIVKARGPQPSYVQVIRSPQELLQYPASQLIVQSSQMIRTDRRLAKLLQCRIGERWFQIRALRRLLAKDIPICWLDLYLLPEYAGVLPKVGRSKQPVYEIIRDMYGERTHAVNVDIGVGHITADMAETLDAAVGDASLRVVRRYLDAERRPFQISVSEHPAERYTYRLQLQYGRHAESGWSVG